jgi:hypothetical protein
MTKQQSERAEFTAKLRETLKPGDTVHTVLRSVSRSGMSRNIDVYKLTPNADGTVSKQWLSYWVSKAIGESFDKKTDCLKVSGCGMDMGFHVVYNLSRVLFCDGFKCCGTGCPANDHTNAYSANRQSQCAVCRKPLNGSELTRSNGHHEVRVCSEACASGNWMHSDPGYALKQEWI